MKRKIFTLLLALIVALPALAKKEITDIEHNYRRISLCSMLVRHSEDKFANEIEEQFLEIPISEQYNDHNLSVRVVEVKSKGKYTPDISTFIDRNNVASRRGDFLFGINGIVTFKNSKLGDVLPAIGLDRILLETDCPYLTPVPFRGRRNESAYIPHIAAKIAELLGTTIDEVSARTDANAQRFFDIDI